MGKERSKKRGKLSSVKNKLKSVSGNSSINESKLELLKRRLELEQHKIDHGKASANEEIGELANQFESIEEEKGESQLDETKEEKEEGKEEEKEEISGKIEEETDKNKIAMQEAVEILQKTKSREIAQQKIEIVKNKNFDKMVKEYQKFFIAVKAEINKIVVGQEDTINGMLRAIIADGHVLVEGVPGIAKTTLIRTLAKATNCSFGRIQFTPDLLPTDIVGISTYQEGKGFYTLKGPIFNNFILADEINRAPPKVQSALLECMAEKQATIAKESFPVPLPFFTMATQNPLESVGTYSLPEAQVDRFLFKVNMGYPNTDEEQKILRSNITIKSFNSYKVSPVLEPAMIVQMQEDAKKVYVDKKVEKYIVNLIDATRFPKKHGITLGKYIEYGSSPRGSIGLFNASRADAFLNGQSYVTPHNVKKVAYDVLRHRMILSYEGQAENIKTEDIITEILKKIPVP
jgi:MoxR-like ATPase